MTETVEELLESARERGFVEMSALEELGERLGLEPAQLEALEARLQDEDVVIRDDTGWAGTPPTRVRPDELAGFTTDAL